MKQSYSSVSGYTSVKLPARLSEMIRESPIFKEYGYRSVSEFVIEATRIKLIEVEKQN